MSLDIFSGKFLFSSCAAAKPPSRKVIRLLAAGASPSTPSRSRSSNSSSLRPRRARTVRPSPSEQAPGPAAAVSGGGGTAKRRGRRRKVEEEQGVGGGDGGECVPSTEEYLVSHGQAQQEQCDTICNLNVIGSSTGLGGLQLVLFRVEGGHKLPPTTFSPGEMVCVRTCNSRGEGATSCKQGIVYNFGEDGCSITVTLESRHGDDTFSRLFGKSVRIDPIQGLADALTYEADGDRVRPMTSGVQSGKKKQQHHFVLIHGVCHGAWCWYRVTTALQAAGHRVTALDMAACGASPGRGEEVASFEEYCRPLLDAVAALPEGEKAVLVGHSFGGQSLALAMERYPEKVAVAVFVTATMPAAGKPMSFAFKQVSQAKGPDFFMDCTLGTTGDPKNPDTTFLFGPKYMERRVYQLSPREDLTLAIAMVRPSRRFLNDETMNGDVLTAERYGAVRCVYVVAEDDESKSPEMQRRIASWNPGTEVIGLQGADHMPMFSKPRELSELLMEIANKKS